MNEKKITAQRIYLIPMNQNLVTEKYLSWLVDPTVSFALSYNQNSLNDLKNYVLKREKDNNCRFWAMIFKETDEHIGNIKLEPIDWETKSTNFGILIGEKKFWGQGIALEALESLVNHAFTELDLNKIELSVASDNPSAKRTYEKAGFQTYKTVFDIRLTKDRVCDVFYMSISKDD